MALLSHSSKLMPGLVMAGEAVLETPVLLVKEVLIAGRRMLYPGVVGRDMTGTELGPQQASVSLWALADLFKQTERSGSLRVKAIRRYTRDLQGQQ